MTEADDVQVEPKKIPPVPKFDSIPDDRPPFMVVDDVFYAQTDQGEMQVSLRIPRKTVPELEDLPALDQVEILLRSRGEEQGLELIGELDIIDARLLARKFFQAFGEKQEARLGESSGSSDS